MTPVEFRGDLWRQKARVPGLPYGVGCVIPRLAVSVELQLVTDTGRQTDCDSDDAVTARCSCDDLVTTLQPAVIATVRRL